MREERKTDETTSITDVINSNDSKTKDSEGSQGNRIIEVALRLAAERGHLDDVEIIMEGVERGHNSVLQENTLLHSAVKTRHPKPEIVSLLVEAYGSQLKSAIDKLGRSPLHVAAIYMSSTRTDYFNVIHELRAFDPNARDFEKETALHIAVKRKNFTVLEAMLEVFYGRHRDVDRHNKDKDGYTLLDICAMNADLEMVSLLLDYGADPRDGVLYHMIAESVRVPERSNDLVKVYRTLIDQADKWSFYKSDKGQNVASGLIGATTTGTSIITDLNRPKYASANIVILLNGLNQQNNDVSAIEYAVDKGAVEMLEAFLHTEQLYEKIEENPEVENSSYFLKVPNCINVNGSWTCDSKLRVIKRSLIERIANHDNATTAGKMFNIEPIRTLVRPHIILLRLFYGLFTVAQIIYMAFFTIYHVPNVCRFEIGRAVFNECNVSALYYESQFYYQNQFSNRTADKPTTCAYAIWPVLLLAFSILFNIQCAVRQGKWAEWLDIWKYSFPVLAIAWLCVFQYPNAKYDYHVVCTALVFMIGWFHVFYFISFFERFTIFARTLKEIISKDFVNYIVLMSILIFGFSWAIITLYQTKPPGMHASRSLTGTAYRAFFDTLSPGSIYLEETESANTDFQSLGGNLHLLRIVIVTYEILTCVILINILIATMNDTYSKQVANAEWIARFWLIRHGMNMRSFWPSGRQVNRVILREELVESICRQQSGPKKNRAIFQKIKSYATCFKPCKNRVPRPKVELGFKIKRFPLPNLFGLRTPT